MHPDESDPAMRRRVEQILTRFGTSIDYASRVTFAQSNEVWLAEHVVVRVGQRERSALFREIALAPAIPAEVGYPKILDHGVIDGHEWMASERLPGQNLGEAWPKLDPPTRLHAITDLWSRLRTLHSTDPAAAHTAGCTWTPYYALDPNRARSQLESLIDRGALDRATGRQLDRMLTSMFEKIHLTPIALTHTDAAPGNTVRTPAGQSIPIDLEFATLTPVDLELENLFRNLFFLADTPTSAGLANLAADLLNRPGAAERLHGYAILRDLWALRLWIAKAHDFTDIPTWAPLQHLHMHADGTNWLSQIL